MNGDTQTRCNEVGIVSKEVIIARPERLYRRNDLFSWRDRTCGFIAFASNQYKRKLFVTKFERKDKEVSRGHSKFEVCTAYL